MTETYRAEQLAIATAEAVRARTARETAKTKKARREADEELTFWSNKVAFLTHAR